MQSFSLIPFPRARRLTAPARVGCDAWHWSSPPLADNPKSSQERGAGRTSSLTIRICFDSKFLPMSVALSQLNSLILAFILIRSLCARTSLHEILYYSKTSKICDVISLTLIKITLKLWSICPLLVVHAYFSLANISGRTEKCTRTNPIKCLWVKSRLKHECPDKKKVI